MRCVDEVFQQLRDAGRLRPELDLQAVRSALLGMIEGLLRDRLLAERMGFPANYSLDELRRIFNVVLPSFFDARE